jgi:hypothetical protein
MIEGGKVLLGLEFESEKSDALLKFDRLVTELRSYGLSLPDLLFQPKRAELGLKDVSEVMKGLTAAAQKLVIVSAEFFVGTNPDDPEGYAMTLVHPLSARLSPRSLKLVVYVDKGRIRDKWKAVYRQAEKRPMQANVFGVVFRANLNPDASDWEIGILPTAIYT